MIMYKFYKDCSFAQLKVLLQQQIKKRNISTMTEYGVITYKLYGRRLLLFYSPGDKEKSKVRVVFRAVVKEKAERKIKISGTFGILPGDFCLITLLMTAFLYFKSGLITAITLALLLAAMYLIILVISSINVKSKKPVIDFLASLNS